MILRRTHPTLWRISVASLIMDAWMAATLIGSPTAQLDTPTYDQVVSFAQVLAPWADNFDALRLHGVGFGLSAALQGVGLVLPTHRMLRMAWGVSAVLAMVWWVGFLVGWIEGTSRGGPGVGPFMFAALTKLAIIFEPRINPMTLRTQTELRPFPWPKRDE